MTSRSDSTGANTLIYVDNPAGEQVELIGVIRDVTGLSLSNRSFNYI